MGNEQKDLLDGKHAAYMKQYGFTLWGSLCLIVSVIGFWPTYVRPITAGTYESASKWMTVHVVSTAIWLVLLIVQPYLIRSNSYQLHKRLGIMGAFVALAVVLTGYLVQLEVMPAYALAGDKQNAVFVPFVRFTLLLGFASCIAIAIAYRRNPVFHGRLMILGSFILLQSPFDRFFGTALGITTARGPLALFSHILIMVSFIVWERKKNGKVHSVSKWSVVIISAFYILSPAMATTRLWESIAAKISGMD